MRTAIAVLLLTAAAVAQDTAKTLPADHPATKRWDESKETYSQAVAGYRKALLKLMQGLEDRARGAGDTELVKQIVADRSRFEKTGDLPKSVKTTTYERDLQGARTVLQREATVAKAAFLTAKLDDAANRVDIEATALVGDAKGQGIRADEAAEWKAKQGHRWIFVGEKRWKEIGPPNQSPTVTTKEKQEDRIWIEVDRQPSYVELKFSKGDGWLRLYRDHADAHYGDLNFTNWGEGTWVKGPPHRPATPEE